MTLIFALILSLVICSEAYWHVSNDVEDESPITDINFDTGKNLRFSAMGKNFDLNLRPADEIFAPNFRVFSARSLDNGETVFEDSAEDNQPLSGSFHSVDGSYGSLYVDQTGDKLKLDGILDDNMRIFTPEPDSYRLVKLGWKRIEDNPYSSDEAVFNASNFHDVMDQQDQSETSDEVTVEILVLTDQATIDELKSHNHILSQYIGIYWNSVQRRFADFTNPRIKFSLTGILKLHPDTMKRSTFKPNHLDGYKLLDDLARVLYEYRKEIPKFDIAMFQTKLDLSSPSSTSGEYNTNLLGRAYVGAVCHENSHDKKMYNCGIGEDDVPLYTGVITTAHEVGHVLGAPHDGIDKAVNCPGSQGYIMGVGHKGPHSWQFSPCSKEIIRNHVQYNSQSQCVKDAPDVKVSIPKTLPGEMKTPDQICKTMYGKEFSLHGNSDDVCNEIHCFNPRNRRVNYFGPPPEGIICGENKYCVGGFCVQKLRPSKRYKSKHF